MARTYKRDSKGRFAGGGGGSGGGGKSRPATKQLQRGANRLTRDNAGRITSVGGSGATAYGGRIRTASGKRRATTVAKGIGKAPKGTVGKPRGLKADKNVTKPAIRKVDTSVSAIARRRSRANAPRTSTYLNQKLNIQGAITRSAANEIYNRQRTIAKALGGRVDTSVARSGIGVVRGLTGSKRQRADELRERARKRVRGGRRR